MHPAISAPQDTFLLSRSTMHRLRRVIDRDVGVQGAAWLQEAGFAGGERMYQAYGEWLMDRYAVARPAALDVRHLGETLSGFFKEFGWGTTQVSPITTAVIAIDSPDWWEAEEEAAAEFPSCHLSSGLLAEFMTRVSETPLGVMEVECRTRGDARCRFLAGAPESLQILYTRMAEGATYLEGLGVQS